MSESSRGVAGGLWALVGDVDDSVALSITEKDLHDACIDGRERWERMQRMKRS